MTSSRTQHDERILDGRVVTDPHQHGGPAQGAADHGGRETHAGHGGHGWMMIACCIPMLVIAVILVATGIASPGFLAAAAACAAMMALMMRGMSHGGGGDGRP